MDKICYYLESTVTTQQLVENISNNDSTQDNLCYKKPTSEHSRSGYLAVRYKYLFDLENRASVTGSSVSWTPGFMSEDNLLEASSGLKSLIAPVSSYQAGIV